MKIITIIGARPQFIKSSMVSKALELHNGVEEIIIHTGQHFDSNMSDVFFKELAIPSPKYNLEVHGLNHGAMTGMMMMKIEPILILEQPDLVIVYGDTNSTLAGAITAKKMHIPVAHIEAGLRSYNNNMPEELNRILVDRISNLLFCPTKQAETNLLNEGFEHFSCKIYNYGDVMKDAAIHFGKMGLIKSAIIKELNLNNFILATMHRAENIDNINHLTIIIETLNLINKSTPVLVPLHPRTKQTIHKLGIQCEFFIIEPVGYIDMLALLQQAEMVITDSGGLQKEAYFFNKFCITMRNETEWIELIEMGFNTLAGCNTSKIMAAYNQFKLQKMDKRIELYGDGNAAKAIASAIVNYLS
jgi:UDP-GlcNAc3NAcA epimerase